MRELPLTEINFRSASKLFQVDSDESIPVMDLGSHDYQVSRGMILITVDTMIVCGLHKGMVLCTIISSSFLKLLSYTRTCARTSLIFKQL